MSCWDCKHLAKGSTRFVYDMECCHPENKQEDLRNMHLQPDELEDGCELEESKDEE